MIGRNKTEDRILAARAQSGEYQVSKINTTSVLTRLRPVCSHCRRVRIMPRVWSRRMGTSVINGQQHHHDKESLSHTLCPTCIREFYPEYADRVIAKVEAEICAI